VYKNASSDDWKRAFKWLFPEPGYKTTNTVQNYPSSPYFMTWMTFIKDPNKHFCIMLRNLEMGEELGLDPRCTARQDVANICSIRIYPLAKFFRLPW